MKNNKLVWAITFVALVLFVALPPVYGGDPARVGTAAGTQLLIPVGARDLALGGANVANTVGLSAIYWNPAGLSSIGTTAGAEFSTMQIFNDITVNYLALAVRAPKLGTFGFSLKSFSFGDIPVTTVANADGTGATFSPTFITLGLTYSRKLTDAIQVGVTAKLVSESLSEPLSASANAVAFDAGIQYHNFGGVSGFSLGMAVKNVGSNMRFSGSGLLDQGSAGEVGFNEFLNRPAQSDELPASIELGAGYKRNLDENNSVLIMGNFQNNNLDNDTYRIGLEYSYSNLISLRGGYRFNQKVDSNDELYTWTLGAGLHYKLGSTDISFDYSYRDSQYFDGNNLFTVRLGF